MKKYTQPKLRNLGTLSSLTLGQGGSCLDGTGFNDQMGGGVDMHGCVSGDAMGDED